MKLPVIHRTCLLSDYRKINVVFMDYYEWDPIMECDTSRVQHTGYGACPAYAE